MKTIAIRRLDGGVSIHRTNDDADIASEVSKCELEVVAYREVAESDVPVDRTFRSAWTDDQAIISVDLDKAKVIHLERIRVKRNVELSKLDIEVAKALDAGDMANVAKLGADRQALRDLPQTVDLNVRTVDELKAVWPF